MKLEVLLSTMNLDKKDLDKMNITSDCTVINQCDKEDIQKYKNFNIYSYDEVGLSNSRNRGLDLVKDDIILLCDDDVVYTDTYEKDIINEFKNNKNADIIIFNIYNTNRKYRINKKSKRLHFYNILNYTSCRIAFRNKSIKDIRFNTLFGSGSKYTSGEDSLFLTDCLNKGLKVYSSSIFIGKVDQKESKWFKGYNEKYFYDKGALFTAINKNIIHILMLQYLIRHPEVLKEYNIFQAYSFMLKGSKEYLNDIRNY